MLTHQATPFSEPGASSFFLTLHQLIHYFKSSSSSIPLYAIHSDSQSLRLLFPMNLHWWAWQYETDMVSIYNCTPHWVIPHIESYSYQYLTSCNPVRSAQINICPTVDSLHHLNCQDRCQKSASSVPLELTQLQRNNLSKSLTNELWSASS